MTVSDLRVVYDYSYWANRKIFDVLRSYPGAGAASGGCRPPIARRCDRGHRARRLEMPEHPARQVRESHQESQGAKAPFPQVLQGQFSRGLRGFQGHVAAMDSRAVRLMRIP